MSLQKPFHKRVTITIAEIFKAEKTEKGIYVSKKGPSKTITVYDATTNEVYAMVKKLFQE